jgi:rubrerythrin
MNRTHKQLESDPTTAKSMAELLTYALALEIEATERYADLAELMEAHNNLRVSNLFSKMSEIESLHADHIRELLDKNGMKPIAGLQYNWASPEGPETIDPEELHYLMTPNQTLNLALFNEKRAFEFFDNVARNAADNETRKLAQELAEEEEEHVAWVEKWLEDYPDTDPDWDYDSDPPFVQD